MCIKMSVTKRIYTIKAYGYEIVIPEGSKVTNKTATGPDDDYYFWTDFADYCKKKTGFGDSLLQHYLSYYGLNIPKEFCVPYPED